MDKVRFDTESRVFLIPKFTDARSFGGTRLAEVRTFETGSQKEQDNIRKD